MRTGLGQQQRQQGRRQRRISSAWRLLLASNSTAVLVCNGSNNAVCSSETSGSPLPLSETSVDAIVVEQCDEKVSHHRTSTGSNNAVIITTMGPSVVAVTVGSGKSSRRRRGGVSGTARKTSSHRCRRQPERPRSDPGRRKCSSSSLPAVVSPSRCERKVSTGEVAPDTKSARPIKTARESVVSSERAEPVVGPVSTPISRSYPQVVASPAEKVRTVKSASSPSEFDAVTEIAQSLDSGPVSGTPEGTIEAAPEPTLGLTTKEMGTKKAQLSNFADDSKNSADTAVALADSESHSVERCCSSGSSSGSSGDDVLSEASVVAREEIPPGVLRTLDDGAKHLDPRRCSASAAVTTPVLAALRNQPGMPTVTDNIRFTLPGTYDIELLEPRYHDVIHCEQPPSREATSTERIGSVTVEVVGQCHQHASLPLELPGQWAMCVERKRRLITQSTATFPASSAPPPTTMRAIAPVETTELLNADASSASFGSAEGDNHGNVTEPSPLNPSDIAALAEKELRVSLDNSSESRLGKTWTKYWHGKHAQTGDVVVSHSHSVYRDSVDVLHTSNQGHYYPLAAKALHLTTGVEAVSGNTKFVRTREAVLSMTNLDATPDPNCKGHYVLASHTGKSVQSLRRVMDETTPSGCSHHPP